MQTSTWAGLAVAGGALGAIWLARRASASSTARAVERPHDGAELPRSSEPPASTTSASADARPAERALTRDFDPLFREYGQGIPVSYLRALGNAESGLNPRDRLGLINVVPIAVRDYNRRHPGANLTPAQMTDPPVNVRVAADTLREIIASYRQHHPDVLELAEDWARTPFLELLTFGWNAGYSEKRGVGRVVRFLRATHPGAPITLDAVADAAHAAGAAATLSNSRKRSYCKGVVAAYRREVARDVRELRLFS